MRSVNVVRVSELGGPVSNGCRALEGLCVVPGGARQIPCLGHGDLQARAGKRAQPSLEPGELNLKPSRRLHHGGSALAPRAPVASWWVADSSYLQAWVGAGALMFGPRGPTCSNNQVARSYILVPGSGRPRQAPVLAGAAKVEPTTTDSAAASQAGAPREARAPGPGAPRAHFCCV